MIQLQEICHRLIANSRLLWQWHWLRPYLHISIGNWALAHEWRKTKTTKGSKQQRKANSTSQNKRKPRLVFTPRSTRKLQSDFQNSKNWTSFGRHRKKASYNNFQNSEVEQFFGKVCAFLELREKILLRKQISRCHFALRSFPYSWQLRDVCHTTAWKSIPVFFLL